MVIVYTFFCSSNPEDLQMLIILNHVPSLRNLKQEQVWKCVTRFTLSLLLHYYCFLLAMKLTATVTFPYSKSNSPRGEMNAVETENLCLSNFLILVDKKFT